MKILSVVTLVISLFSLNAHAQGDTYFYFEGENEKSATELNDSELREKLLSQQRWIKLCINFTGVAIEIEQVNKSLENLLTRAGIEMWDDLQIIEKDSEGDAVRLAAPVANENGEVYGDAYISFCKNGPQL